MSTQWLRVATALVRLERTIRTRQKAEGAEPGAEPEDGPTVQVRRGYTYGGLSAAQRRDVEDG